MYKRQVQQLYLVRILYQLRVPALSALSRVWGVVLQESRAFYLQQARSTVVVDVGWLNQGETLCHLQTYRVTRKTTPKTAHLDEFPSRLSWKLGGHAKRKKKCWVEEVIFEIFP